MQFLPASTNIWTVGGTGLLTLKMRLKLKLLFLAIQLHSGRIKFGSPTLGPRLIFMNLATSDLLLETFCLVRT